MILSLLITYVSAGSAPLVCEQIFDPLYCKGPAAGTPGHTCAWQPSDLKCKAINMNNPEEHCKTLSHNQAACQAKPDCHYELYDGECKGIELEYERHEHQAFPPAVPAATAPAAAGYPPAAGGAATGYPPATPHAAPAAAAPATPGYPPAAGGAATGYPPATPQAAGAAPGYPAPAAPVAPVAPAAPVAPRPTTPAPAPLPPARPAAPFVPPQPSGPRFCKMLPEPQCFGPATEPGKLCMWDAEDFECSEATRFDVEAVCKQFGRDPTACDTHENCYWDQFDYECSEIEFGKGFKRPMLTQLCSGFRAVNTCSGQSSCYWDTSSNNCVNVFQASNVCSVYTTAALCATNHLCIFRGNVCTLSSTGAGGYQKLNLRSAHEGAEPASSTTTTDYFVMFACGFSGSLLGLLFALGTQKMCQRRASQDDYRDIVLDVNSHRRQVV